MKTLDQRRLIDLVSVGPATIKALKMLRVTSVNKLALCDADVLYERFNKKLGKRVDPCWKDILSAAIAQARNPRLPLHKRQWWYWSHLRVANKH